MNFHSIIRIVKVGEGMGQVGSIFYTTRTQSSMISLIFNQPNPITCLNLTHQVLIGLDWIGRFVLPIKIYLTTLVEFCFTKQEQDFFSSECCFTKQELTPSIYQNPASNYFLAFLYIQPIMYSKQENQIIRAHIWVSCH